MANYTKDKTGQWYYVWGKDNQYRQRAYEYTCQQCGKAFVKRKSYNPDHGRFCGKSCAGKQFAKLEMGVTAKGEKSPHWQGGRRKRKQYIMIYMPDHPFSDEKGYVWEHRYVMEQHIGRYLKPLEEVHHIDANPENNIIDNLQLITRSDHRKLHDKNRKRDASGRYLPD
jgi:hypothetical protein